ncbi:mandelate racemase/muconate lactonizing enzyme family protein [Azospirillum agricola]|uniref:mandelate racemase/muconate lactonizing enzyme family protein n=1 Tax=Azospirillum agricola TaxID=1720247 RepID=UPI000A0F0675|nr:mandelate racemase/muconate lactonizing enzyme family protein [Azospirillum agricola]SMH39243.1 galactonate dehydratase [Azospirillum lipoferum]
MKITKATIYAINSEGLKPVIVKLDTDEGISGLGEVATAYGCGRTGAAGMIQDLCARFVIGADPTRINSLVGEMYDQSFWLKNPGGVAGAGLSAIEQALWDIRARALNVPVHELFGGRMRDTLAYYANGWYFGATSVGDLLRQAEAAVKDGHKALKMYPLARIQPNGTLRHTVNRYADDREAVNAALDIVAQVRRTVGADVTLMLDLAGGFSVSDTIRFVHGLEELDIAFIEEISDPGDLGALEQVAAKTNIPIATGERQYLRYGFRDLLERRAVGILQPDIGNTGGFAEAHKIAAMADAYGVKVQPHVCGSSVAASIATHLSAVIPNFYVQEHFPYWARVPGWIEVATEPFETRLKNGALQIPDGPGYGVTLKDAVVREHIWAEVR